MKLLSTATLGALSLKNSVVMAPMTRSRAIGGLANELMAQYYSQRSGAGLIVTEGVSPSPNGLGYARIPGLYNEQQMVSWRQVTDAVHKNGARIFLQLMHTGRVCHPANMPAGSRIVAPSAMALSGNMWTDAMGMQPHPRPEEMSRTDIQAAIQEFVHSARLAIQAGFDGVELHAANGYLLEQFLNPNANKRQDEFGGEPDQKNEGRMRFVLEIARAVAREIGPDRTGIRVSPYGVFNDMGAFKGVDEFYGVLAGKLSEIGLVYIHVVDHSAMGAPGPSPEVKRRIRQAFKGKYILSGGYNAGRAERDLAEGKGDLVAFGRSFLANPDLVEKLKNSSPLKPANPATFYTPGAEGYTDY